MTTMTYEATFHERGNGFADVGDYVAGDDDQVYRVCQLVGRVHTGAAGAGNYIHALVALDDWDDIEESDEPTCSAVIGRPLADRGEVAKGS